MRILPLLVGLIAGCDEAAAPAAAPSFRISPRRIELVEGQFTTVALFTNLSEYQVISQVNWSFLSDPPSNAVGFSSGFLRPLPWEVTVHGWEATTGLIIAQHSARPLADTIPILVHRASVAAVNLAPASSSIAVGQSTDIHYEVLDSVGNPLQRQVAWTSSDSTMATIEYTPRSGFSSGLARVWGVGPGQATISARAEGVTSAFTIVVTEP
ncbi:MAG TPA: Ig-like domain-containing protein [Gemmatimonadales bacterium]|nr:Ig-like domain-containing protein [Gemmatimonadales bacterium]